MNDISSILTDYIRIKDTDYAILLSGPWGSGKTHYVKHTLFRTVREIRWRFLLRYAPVYISLNGLTRVEEISDKILLSKLGLDESASTNVALLKSSLEVAKSLPFPFFRAIGESVIGLGSLVYRNLSDNLNLSSNVIFIDDVERVDKSLALSTVLGYIHSNYVEHDGIKVVLIADGSVLEKDCGYKTVKEKVIGRVVAFSQSIEKILTAFVSSRYASQRGFQELLLSHSDRIVAIFKKAKEVNLRTLSFSLDSLWVLHQASTGYVSAFGDMLTFAFAVCLDFKKGFLDETDSGKPKELDNLAERYQVWRAFPREKEEKPYNVQFYERYFLESPFRFVFIKAVYEYVLTGHLDQKMLSGELQSLLEQEKEDEKEIAYHNLFYFSRTEEEDLIAALQLSLKYAKEGQYIPRQYVDICTAIDIIRERDYLPGKVPPDYFESLKGGLQTSLERISREHPETGSTDYWRDIIKTNPLLNVKELAGIAMAYVERRIKEQSRRIAAEFLDSLDKPDRSFIAAWEKVDKTEIFETIASEGLAERLYALNNMAIYNIEAILYADFRNVANAGSVFSRNIEPLRSISRVLQEKLASEEVGHLKRKRLTELVEALSITADHIENTKGR
jgi:hypothetical protein